MLEQKKIITGSMKTNITPNESELASSPNKKVDPSLEKVTIARNPWPIISKNFLTKSTFITPIAIIN